MNQSDLLTESLLHFSEKYKGGLGERGFDHVLLWELNQYKDHQVLWRAYS